MKKQRHKEIIRKLVYKEETGEFYYSRVFKIITADMDQPHKEGTRDE